ncbi:hypothetical protein P5673_020832 [Acropora cervicornis]|uniref:Uncharacterized protein n=1 Tax=Acropora cervicornis TaxID=6130 RepID=A0AAD9Q9R5_ACRCE|nr:hypothetical protein P5673_020832 [Acropora cervicornis]
MATDIEMADESNSAELDVVGDSRLVQPTNAYGSPLAGASSRRNENARRSDRIHPTTHFSRHGQNTSSVA